MGDDKGQSEIAQATLANAECVALPLPALCELVRVLTQGYKIDTGGVCEALRRLIYAGNVSVNRPAAEAGLALLASGGDFADGVIAYEGNWLGGEIFASFDKKAAKLIKAQGKPVRLLESNATAH